MDNVVETVTKQGGARSIMRSAGSRPFLRWAGSKRKLLPRILPLFPRDFGRYFEPFLGSGSVFFECAPQHAVLGDLSPELISTYEAIRENVDGVIGWLKLRKPNREFFYDLRKNRSSDKIVRAAEFIYLNKTCWNGLYRVNKRGEFNVPYGMPKSDYIYDERILRACAKILQSPGVDLACRDFEETLSGAGEGDLVFIDPPYVTGHNNNGFVDWNESIFSWKDQRRLAKLAQQLALRGANVVVTNADHGEIHRLYAGFAKIELTRASTLASSVAARKRVSEAIFLAGPDFRGVP